jgi:Family of unknown function (DUF6281)
MRRIVTVACLALACLGCSSGSRDELVSSGASCAARITWDGALYYGQTFPSLPPSTLSLGTGGRPTCSDANGGEAGASTTVQVRRLLGVDPRVAVAVQGDRYAAYLAAGYFVQLPSHPLHGRIEWSARSLDELIGCAKSRTMRLKGRVRYGPSTRLDVSERDAVARRYVGAEALLFVDARTRVDGLARNGLPYVAPGTAVAVDAVGCLGSDGRLRKLVPRLLAPA